METIKRETIEVQKTDETKLLKVGSSSGSESRKADLGSVDDRDDISMDDAASGKDERDESVNSKKSLSKPSPSSKKGKKPSPSISSSSSFGQDGYYPPYAQMPPGRCGHYPHGMHSGRHPPPPGPSGPYHHHPPPYYGGPHDHYRGPPPSHYHQMPPPLPHQSQGNHYGSGPYGHPPNMTGRPGPPPTGYHGYGPPYPGPPPPGYHGGPPSHYPSNGLSDSSSISSSRSKRSSKSQSSSNGSRKKRTIDGVDGKKDKSNLPLAYSFRRTNSNSSNSTLTTAKNTTTEQSSVTDSPHKNDRVASRNSQFLPPMGQSDNIFEKEREKGHCRSNSGASTASSLSVGGFSLSSYEGPKTDGVVDDVPMLKSSPKRRKGEDSAPLPVGSNKTESIFKRKGSRLADPSDQSIDGAESNRFEQLTMNDAESKKDRHSLFLTLSTSPINHPDETPISKNTKKKGSKITVKTDMDEDFDTHKKDTPTPPALGVQTDMTDEHTLNNHLRGQTFTPLPHAGDSGISPSNAAFSALAPSLSWSIAGDTPSLEDLAACSWEETDRDDRKRPDSTTSHLSSATRNLVISPHNFSLWKEEHESKKNDEHDDDDDDDDDMKDEGESIRLSMLSPNSEIVDRHAGTTTPLPIFFRDSGSDERENLHSDKKSGSGKDFGGKDSGADINMQHKNMFMYNGPPRPSGPRFFPHGMHRDGLPPTPVFAGNKPPTPHFPGSGMGFARSPLHGDRHDYGPMYGHPPPGHPNDRIRNLRGRMPPGAHMAPLPIHIPPPMSSHHPLTSPMGLPGRPPWSPQGMPPHMTSPHHMSPIDMSQSKRKCVPLKPPIPSKFQGDMDKTKGASVPEFTSLVNFPAHMSQKQAVNLPDNMRCCVMCGQACPCSTGNKTKKPVGGLGGKKDGNTSELSDKNGFAIIPTQNKGLCTLCDVNVWVVCSSGLEIKWCKGCKNFRPWAAFGDKGLATKCLRCRERQREKYALQKEEKEKARMQKNKAKV